MDITEVVAILANHVKIEIIHDVIAVVHDVAKII